LSVYFGEVKVCGAGSYSRGDLWELDKINKKKKIVNELFTF
jgi:hypothetical protein